MHVIIAIRVILIHFDPVMTDSFMRAWRDVEPEEQKDDEWVDACSFLWGRLQLLDRRRRGSPGGDAQAPLRLPKPGGLSTRRQRGGDRADRGWHRIGRKSSTAGRRRRTHDGYDDMDDDGTDDVHRHHHRHQHRRSPPSSS